MRVLVSLIVFISRLGNEFKDIFDNRRRETGVWAIDIEPTRQLKLWRERRWKEDGNNSCIRASSTSIEANLAVIFSSLRLLGIAGRPHAGR